MIRAAAALLAVAVYAMIGAFAATNIPLGIALGAVFARCTASAGWPTELSLARYGADALVHGHPFALPATVIVTAALGAVAAFVPWRTERLERAAERYFLRVPAVLAAIAVTITVAGSALAYRAEAGRVSSISVGGCAL